MEAIIKPQRKMQYNLRIDQELHDWLKEVAAENERPVNFVITQAIKKLRNEIESAKA
ncbi:Arc family DNA-binding protein [Acinetobacter sp. Marseille-P8610]|uniref:Arc family DNA-binding protein n=1 Tax=Acinetobacter sp. Marseille-P8610 TaxID=2864459 RepID=UPI001CE452ED|nr:Arc family DNA-binding protein [Acinetobacter sp. Marseille-P8610]